MCGMPVSAPLFHLKFKEDLEDIGFKFNPCNACAGNRMTNGHQHTVRFHVDDPMSSHEDSEVNDRFQEWLNLMCGQCGEVTAMRGKADVFQE